MAELYVDLNQIFLSPNQGDDGLPGFDGRPGVDGENAKDAAPPVVKLPCQICPPGPPGKPGPAGPPGSQPY